MSIRKIWFPTLLGVLLTLFLFMFAVLFKGVHDIFPVVFFPYFILFATIVEPLPQWITIAMSSILVFVQYPVYGAILGNVVGESRFYKRLLLLISLHALATLACLMIYNP